MCGLGFDHYQYQYVMVCLVILVCVCSCLTTTSVSLLNQLTTRLRFVGGVPELWLVVVVVAAAIAQLFNYNIFVNSYTILHFCSCMFITIIQGLYTICIIIARLAGPVAARPRLAHDILYCVRFHRTIYIYIYTYMVICYHMLHYTILNRQVILS